MKRLCLLALVLTACATTTVDRGYFLASDQAQVATGLGLDAANRLVANYEPEQAWRLEQPADDAFGRAFTTTLRKSGHQVYEGGASGSSAMPLRYVVDQLKGTNLLRVILYVETVQLARVYADKGGAPTPAGPWTVRSAQ